MPVTRTVAVAWPEGFHARSVRSLAETARSYDADVDVERTDGDAATADAASLLELIALGVDHGDTVRLRATGPEADATIDALATLLADATEGEV